MLLCLPPVVLAQARDLAPDTVRAIDRLFGEWDRATSPGCAVGVFDHGHVVHARGYGMADLERGVPLDEHAVFDLASTSKQFFACAILLLEHDGKLSLDDDIRKHLPAMPDHGKPVTVRHLLHHTSGIRDYLELMSLAGMPFGNDHPEAEILALLARQQQLNFAPGAEHLYSNSGYFLLGEIVRRVAGMTPGQFLRERVFLPLGMRSTSLYDDHRRIVPRRAIGYLPDGAGGFATELYQFDLVGDGGVLTSLEDLRRWDANFHDNRLGGGAALIERMLTPGRLDDGKVLDYACGLSVGTYRGLRVVHHGGAWAGYRSQFLRFPEQRVAIAVLANLGTFDPDAKAHEIADLVLADRLGPRPEAAALDAAVATPAVDADAPAPVAGDPAQLAPLAGHYRSDQGRVWGVVLSGDHLQLHLTDAMQFRLVPLPDGRFDVVGAPAPIRLAFQEQGRVLAVQIAEREPRRYLRIEPWTPSPAELGECAGEYHSVELDCTWRLTVTDAGLRLGIGYQEEVAALVPSVRDEFAMGGTVVVVQRDDHGRITGLTANAGRVRGIGFVRR